MASQPTRKYLWILGGCLGGCLSALAAFNLLVDPFGAYPALALERLEPYRNHSKTRIAKAELVEQNACDAVILGSSRAETGFLPTHPAFGSTNVYNLGLGGTHFDELRHVFDYTLERRKPKLVMVVLDFHMFTEVRTLNPTFSSSRFNPDLDVAEYHLKNLLGWNATAASVKVLRGWAKKQPAPQPGHGFAFKNIPAKLSQRKLFEQRITFFMEDPKTWAAFTYSPRQVESFQELVRACKGSNTRLIVVLPPVHALDLETIRLAGFWDTFERWKGDLVKAIQQEQATEAVPLWDFTSYQGFAAEPVPAEGDATTRMQWYFENSHFTPALGNIVLDRILGKTGENPAFGVQLTPSNLERELVRIRTEREAYAQTANGDIAWLEALVARIKARKSTAIPELE